MEWEGCRVKCRQFVVTVQEGLEFALFLLVALLIVIGLVGLFIEMIELMKISPTALLPGASTAALAAQQEAASSAAVTTLGERIFRNVLYVMDTVLILIIAVEILRTLAVSLIEHRFYVQAAIEAAIVAMVREIISAEIRHRSPLDILVYSLVVLVLVAAILVMRYILKKFPIEEL